MALRFIRIIYTTEPCFTHIIYVKYRKFRFLSPSVETSTSIFASTGPYSFSLRLFSRAKRKCILKERITMAPLMAHPMAHPVVKKGLEDH